VHDLPSLVVATVICVYWTYVGVMVVRRRRRTHKLAGVVPEQPLERVMGLIWVPLVAAWMTLPWLAFARSSGVFSLPEFARAGGYTVLRWLAAGVAVAALLATIRCWRQMGRNWTMAVTRDEAKELITDGMFGRVRHPIYALSILLMICTVVVVPTLPVLLMAVVHIALMITKARNEERFLRDVHGARYADYCAATGRFLPPFGRRVR